MGSAFRSCAYFLFFTLMGQKHSKSETSVTDFFIGISDVPLHALVSPVLRDPRLKVLLGCLFLLFYFIY